MFNVDDFFSSDGLWAVGLVFPLRYSVNFYSCKSHEQEMPMMLSQNKEYQSCQPYHDGISSHHYTLIWVVIFQIWWQCASDWLAKSVGSFLAFAYLDSPSPLDDRSVTSGRYLPGNSYLKMRTRWSGWSSRAVVYFVFLFFEKTQTPKSYPIFLSVNFYGFHKSALHFDTANSLMLSSSLQIQSYGKVIIEY